MGRRQRSRRRVSRRCAPARRLPSVVGAAVAHASTVCGVVGAAQCVRSRRDTPGYFPDALIDRAGVGFLRGLAGASARAADRARTPACDDFSATLPGDARGRKISPRCVECGAGHRTSVHLRDARSRLRALQRVAVGQSVGRFRPRRLLRDGAARRVSRAGASFRACTAHAIHPRTDLTGYDATPTPTFGQCTVGKVIVAWCSGSSRSRR